MLLKLNDRAEVTERLFPLLLEDVDLPSGNVSLNVAWIAQQSLGKGPQRTLVIVDPSIGDREHDEHGLSVVGTLLDQVAKIRYSFRGLSTVKIGYSSVEKGIVIRLVHVETLGEHFNSFAVLLLGQEYFTRFKVLFTFK